MPVTVPQQYQSQIDKWRRYRVQYRKESSKTDEYRLKHRIYMAEERKANPDHNRMLARKSYRKHAERRRADARRNRALMKNDPVRLAHYRTWCLNRIKARKVTDPQFRLRWQMRTRILQALKEGYKHSSTVELVGCSLKELKEHIERQWLPGMTWANYGKHGWHLDHIKPCVSFDLTDQNQQRQCFHFSNVRPLWAADNLSKGATSDTGEMFQRIK